MNTCDWYNFDWKLIFNQRQKVIWSNNKKVINASQNETKYIIYQYNFDW